jgi:hypothetical protein
MGPIVRFTLGLAVYFATLYVGVLIATALHPELARQDPSFMHLVLVFPGGILHFMLVILLARVANHPRWWPSLILAALSAAIFVVCWYSYSL